MTKAQRRREYWEAENEKAMESGDVRLMFRVACRWLLAEAGRRRHGEAHSAAHIIFCETVDKMAEAAQKMQAIDGQASSTGL